MSRRWPEPLRRRSWAQALRLYARLLMEHERVRRLAARSTRRCRPRKAALTALREMAFFHGCGRRALPLREFCSRHPEADGDPATVPADAYRAALAAALQLAGDPIVRHGGQPPWGAGSPRAPQSTEAFEAIARRLRDLDSDADEHGSLADILDADLPPEPPEERAGRPVVLDAAIFVLDFEGTRVAVPEGGERDFLRTLLEASRTGEVTPVSDHGRYWKTAVDTLRRRIRRATGRNLLGRVVLSARGPVGGYRLNPNVRVVGAAEAGLTFLPSEELDALDPRRPRRPSRPPRDD